MTNGSPSWVKITCGPMNTSSISRRSSAPSGPTAMPSSSGSGASYILPKEVCLRLLVVAPLEARIQNVMRTYKVADKEARRRVIRTEADRRAFIRKYFQADMMDPINYDLVINTEHIDIDLAARIVKETFNSRQWYDYSGKK
ncbi:MAG: cytidylate kinase-like family protein [Desulfobacterales bacterium]|nr:cytidylate kinase-like family protein [Desulfobacterales bacterium]